MELQRAIDVAVESCELRERLWRDSLGDQAAATLRAWLPFIKAAEEHFAGERNYASVIDAYRAAKGKK